MEIRFLKINIAAIYIFLFIRSNDHGVRKLRGREISNKNFSNGLLTFSSKSIRAMWAGAFYFWFVEKLYNFPQIPGDAF